MAKARRRRARSANRWSQTFGWDPRATLAGGRGAGTFWRDARRFRALGGRIDEYRPRFGEAGADAGSADGHYFWQDLLVARRVAETNPERHVDLGSRLDGFVAHLLVFRSVDVVDVRPMSSVIPGLTFVQADGRTLAGIADTSIESLSSLHALEHFGLGRYGDELDPLGHHRGLEAAQRVLASEGRLWVSFPIGRPSVQFNEQRVLDPWEPLEVLDELRLVDFTAIPAAGTPVYSADPRDFRNDDFWCGLYEFERPPRSSERAAARPGEHDAQPPRGRAPQSSLPQ